MIPIPTPPSRPPRFVRDLDFFEHENGGGPRKKRRIAPIVFATFLTLAVFLNTTAVFADDASSTDATAPSDTASSIVAPTDTSAPAADATSTTDTAPSSTDNPIPDASADVTTPTSTATDTGSDASTTIMTTASSTDETSSSTDQTATSTQSGSSQDDQTIGNDTSTNPAPPAPSKPVDADQSAVRSELEAQLETAYQAQLAAALAAAQSKLDATEKADEDTMRQELTSEIQKKLTAGCLSFDDGSYFCVNPSQSSGTFAAPAAYENVYAAKDPQTGNEQIYFQQSGGVQQITHTSYDNIQPVFNKDRSLIAWQGLVNDRWQIFAYDVATGATSMISGGAENNINPTVEGRRIAWQGWDGNWEIYLSQPAALASSTATEWDTKEVTHDPWANVEPQLAGGLLAWQSYRTGSWQIVVDDLSNGTISQVSEGSGVNTDPHFLLTWNSQQNGQSQTLQYDISSGAVSVLGPSQAPAPIVPFPVPPATKNNATLPAGSASSSSSTSTASKSQGDGDNTTI